MSLALIDHKPPERRRDHSKQMKELSDEAAAVLKLHSEGKIDGDEASRRIKELTTRHRTFLDRLIG